jgi:dynein heavy chain
MANGQISKSEMSFFISGGLILHSSPAVNPEPEWLTDKAWEEIKRSTNLQIFKYLMDDFMGPSIWKWKKFYNAVNPETTKLPEPWENNLTGFQKLIIMRMIRPDKVIPKVEFIILQRHLSTIKT